MNRFADLCRAALLMLSLAFLAMNQALAAGNGSHGHGEILWDTYGTPHIFAKDTVGLFYGFGYAQARAHAGLILLLYEESRGRAAEYWGDKYVDTDRYILANGVWPRAEGGYKQQTPEMRS